MPHWPHQPETRSFVGLQFTTSLSNKESKVCLLAKHLSDSCFAFCCRSTSPLLISSCSRSPCRFLLVTRCRHVQSLSLETPSFWYLCLSKPVLHYVFQSVRHASIHPHSLPRPLCNHPTSPLRPCFYRKHQPLDPALTEIPLRAPSCGKPMRRHRCLHHQQSLCQPDIQSLRGLPQRVSQRYPCQTNFTIRHAPHRLHWACPARWRSAIHMGGAEYGRWCSRRRR